MSENIRNLIEVHPSNAMDWHFFLCFANTNNNLFFCDLENVKCNVIQFCTEWRKNVWQSNNKMIHPMRNGRLTNLICLKISQYFLRFLPFFLFFFLCLNLIFSKRKCWVVVFWLNQFAWHMYIFTLTEKLVLNSILALTCNRI